MNITQDNPSFIQQDHNSSTGIKLDLPIIPSPKCKYCGSDLITFMSPSGWSICEKCFIKVFDFFYTDWSFRTFFSQLKLQQSGFPNTVITVSPCQHKCRYFQQEFCSLYDSECSMRTGVISCEGFEE